MIGFVLGFVVFACAGRAAPSSEERAVPLRTPPPEYPLSLRQAKVEGIVALELKVSTSGDVIDAKVINTSDARLNPYALRAVKRWKFRAAKVDDTPVECVVQVPLSFRLED